MLTKLAYAEEWTEGRRDNARAYQHGLEGLHQVLVPRDRPYERAVYHTFVIQAEHRDSLKKHLAASRVGTAIHYPTPIHLHEAARDLGYGAGSFPVTERQAGRVLSLPVYPELGSDELEYVVDRVHSFYQAVGLCGVMVHTTHSYEHLKRASAFSPEALVKYKLEGSVEEFIRSDPEYYYLVHKPRTPDYGLAIISKEYASTRWPEYTGLTLMDYAEGAIESYPEGCQDIVMLAKEPRGTGG